MRRVTVTVPATTANLGPGFDSLGLALDIFNTVTVTLSQERAIQVEGEGADSLSRGEDNLVYRSLMAFYQRVGQPPPVLSLYCRNHIPLGRGLGSSAAAVVGGLVAANTLSHQPLSPEELLALAYALEGHPDNVAPALLGGCQVAVTYDSQVRAVPVPLPAGLEAIIFIPAFPMPTPESRLIIPQKVDLKDAVFNVSRTALLVAALATDKLEHLALATQDRLHQPARAKLLPAMGSLFDAALKAGARGVFLSGGGSAVVALSRGNNDEIAHAMAQAAAQRGVAGETRMARPSPTGAQVVEAE